MRSSVAPLTIALALAGCDRAATDARNESLAGDRARPADVAANADQSIEPGESGGPPDARNLVEEGPIDLKSGQGAGLVLQNYAALLEQGSFAEARRLWTNGGAGSELSQDGFAQAYGKIEEIHAEIGAPGAVEGAAGSAYVELPLRFYGKRKGGQAFSSAGTATLRRVNEVPGSTEEQRRWHIYRIDVQPPL